MKYLKESNLFIKDKKYLKLFESSDSVQVYELFLKQYPDDVLIELIDDQLNNAQISINDQDIEFIDSDSIEEIMEYLEDLIYVEYDNDYSGFDNNDRRMNVQDIEEYVFWQFAIDAQILIKDRVDKMTKRYISKQLLKIFENDPALLTQVYDKHKELIDAFVKLPDYLKRGGKGGLWGMKTKE